MQVGVVSDTHGHVEFTRAAVRVLESFPLELVIHCGDIGSTEVVRLFTPWPTHFVLGNVDYDQESLRRSIEAEGQTCHGRFGSVERCGIKIAFLHGDDAEQFRAVVRSGEWDLICYGHTHEARQHREGGTLLLNPGALYRASRHTIAVVELPSLKVASIEI